jgi:Ca2+-binding RTX toxin-like protein
MRDGVKLIAYVPFTKTYATSIGGLEDAGPMEWLLSTAKEFETRQVYYDGMGGTINVDFDFHGKGFTYVGGYPVTGTVQSINVLINNQPAVDLIGAKVDATDFAKYLTKQSPFGLFATLLVGDDFIKGSDFTDTLFGFKGNDKIFAWGGFDKVDGGPGNDINDGGPGNDYLQDTKGKDWFQFSADIKLSSAADNLGYNYDTIKSFGQGDKIYLSTEYFTGIGLKLDASEFVKGPAAIDGNDHILWYNKVGYFDPDGNGSAPAIPFFTIENDAQITNKSFLMGVQYDPY